MQKGPIGGVGLEQSCIERARIKGVHSGALSNFRLTGIGGQSERRFFLTDRGYYTTLRMDKSIARSGER